MKIVFDKSNSDQFQNDLVALGSLLAMITTSGAKDNRFAKRWFAVLEEIYKDARENKVREEYTVPTLESLSQGHESEAEQK